MNTLTHIAAALIISILMHLPGFAQQEKGITIRGKVRTELVAAQQPTLELCIIGRPNVMIPIASNGSFRVDIPFGATAFLAYACPGHLNKTILLNSQNASAGVDKKNEGRKINFDVELPFVDADAPLAFLVGRISFLRGSGLMKVAYDHDPAGPADLELIAAEFSASK